jgi:hypothetical protein
MVYLSAFSLLVSMIGLYILLFASFALKDDQKPQPGFINKESRKIRIRQEKVEPEEPKTDKPSPQFITLLQTIILGELVGLFFFGLSENPMKFRILTVNAGFLLIASLFCSVLTLFNAWFKKKTNIQFRIILQAITLIVGIVLMKLSVRDKIEIPSSVLVWPYYFFYSTVVISLFTMLYNVITGNKLIKVDFNFNSYLIQVIISGLIIGTGLYITSSLRF